MDPEAAQRAVGGAKAAAARVRDTAELLSSVFRQAAAALDKSAELAEQHAYRCDQAGRTEDGARERRAAARAREAARRARSHSERALQQSRTSSGATNPSVDRSRRRHADTSPAPFTVRRLVESWAKLTSDELTHLCPRARTTRTHAAARIRSSTLGIKHANLRSGAPRAARVLPGQLPRAARSAACDGVAGAGSTRLQTLWDRAAIRRAIPPRNP
jgi:hypothetical protein